MNCPCHVHPHTEQNIEFTQYDMCCKPFHCGDALAHTAEQLMRSRYSAYVLSDIDYIVATTVPAQQNALDVQAIADWSKQTQWKGLVIEDVIPAVGKHHAKVSLSAYFFADESLHAHREKSAFVRMNSSDDGELRWYFIDPTVSNNISQKSPCWCESGKKFKHCCGQFL